MVCQHIREITDVPIIMLTFQNWDGEVVKGLEPGADDFPLNRSPSAVSAGVRAVLNRARSPVTTNNYLVYDDGLLPISFPFYSK